MVEHALFRPVWAGHACGSSRSGLGSPSLAVLRIRHEWSGTEIPISRPFSGVIRWTSRTITCGYSLGMLVSWPLDLALPGHLIDCSRCGSLAPFPLVNIFAPRDSSIPNTPAFLNILERPSADQTTMASSRWTANMPSRGGPPQDVCMTDWREKSRERPTRRDTRDRYDRERVSRSRSPSRNDDRDRDRRSYRDRDERSPNGHRDSGRYDSYSSNNNRPSRSYDDRISQDKAAMAEEKRTDSQQDLRVYVGNLSYDVTWKQLKDFMRQAGEVKFADVLLLPNGMSKVSRCFGWFTGFPL
jgi:hypothetical protein